MSPLSGNAGFRYTPTGGTEKTHVLEYPMKFEVAPSKRKRRWTVDSQDYSAHEVISIASGRAEIETTLRFNRKSADLLDMLEQGADGITLTYYPDLSINTGYDLWLTDMGNAVQLEPMAGRWSLGDYEVRVRFRDASASGTSLEALFSPWLFRYDAGMARDDITFTRTGTARQIGQFGVLESAATGLPRDGHWPLVDGVRTPSLLLEGARTNLVTSPEDFGTTPWPNASGTVTRTTGQADPEGGTGATNVADDDGGLVEAMSHTLSAPSGDGTKSLSLFVKAATSDETAIAWYDSSAAVLRHRVVLTWASGALTGVVTESGAGTIYATEEYPNGWYRVRFSAEGVVAANTNQMWVYPAGLTAADTGTVRVFGAQAEDAITPSSYIGSGTRNAETFYAPFVHAPQAMTVYVKFVERGTIETTNARLLHVGSETALSTPYLVLLQSGNNYRISHNDGTTDAAVTLAAGPSIGDTVEVRGVLNADGSVTIGQSINSAAETTGTTATTADLKTAWAGQRVYLNSAGSTGRGLNAFLSVKIASGTKTLAEMRSL